MATPAPDVDADAVRRLAWANSLCAAFLLLGLAGAPGRVAPTLRPAPVEEVIPTLFEPPEPPPPVEAAPAASEPGDDTPPPETPEPPPEIVRVAADTSAVAFAVPTLEPAVVAPLALASPPRPRPVPQPAPQLAKAVNGPPTPTAPPAPPAPPAPTVFTGAGTSGDYPVPAYPRDAMRRRLEGNLILLVVVDAGGLAARVEVREPSGHSLLDQHAADWVKRRWLFPSGAVRHYLVPFKFKLH